MKTIIRENTTNKPSTTIKTTIATLIWSLIISSCGWSNGNKWTPNQWDTPNWQTPVTQPWDKKPPKDNEEPPKNWEEIKFKIQANWPIKWANITIQTLDWNIIYSWITTNNNWEITINKTQLTKALELHNIEPNTHIEIIAQWWTDINWINTDNQKYETQKEQIQQEINWTITAILSSTNINNSIITPLSKNIQILLSWENWEKTENYYINWKINTEKINQQILKILKTLWVVDINKDWKIDNKDITQYDMQKYESKLEQQIKQNWFLKSIYTWKKENRETHIINQLIQLWEINTNNIELPQTTNWEIEQIQETEKKPPIWDSQNKQTTETYTTKTVTWVNQEEVNALTSELDTLKTNLNNTENNLDNQQTQLTTIQNNLTQTDTSLTTSYNNSDQTTKTLANKNYTTTEKEQAINDKITTQIKIAINTQNNYWTPPKETQQTITDKITKESINDWKQILTNKITILKQEIGPLKQKVEEKKEAYDKKYEEYLQAKEEYEEAQRLFKYRDDKYTTLKQEVKDLESDVISYRRKKNLADDEYLKIKIPKTSNYPVSSYKNTNYKNKITTVKKLVFTYRWYDIKWYFKFSSEWWFPWKLWVEKDNSKMWDDTDINSPTHLNDIDDLIKQAIQYKLDYEYNDDKLDETQKQLDQKIKDRDDAEENRFLYWLIKWVDEEYCEIEEEEYNSAKNEYDIENNKLQKKLTLLEKYKTQLIALQNLLTNLNNYTIQEENTQEEITTIKEELNQLKQEKTAKETALEKAQKWEEREVIEKHITHTEEIPIRTKKIQIAIKIPKENKNPEEIKEEIKQKIEEIKLLIENNTKEITKIVTYKWETILLTTMVVYYTDWENKYPAMIWWDYTAFWLTRETKAYTIDEVYPWEWDWAIGHFKNKILEDVNNLELSEYQKLDKQDEWNLFEYKTIIHTDLKNQQTRYPAKVWIIYKIWWYEYREYSNIEVVNKQEETQELQKLISIKQWLYYEEWW